MKTSIQNEGAKQVKKMVENNENLKSIISFAQGYGFDLSSYSSHVSFINGKMSIKIRRECFYYLF